MDEADGCIIHVTPARLEEERVFERDLAALREAAQRLAIPMLVARDGVSRRELRPFVRPADIGWAECDLAPATIDEDPLGLAAAQALELLLKAHRADLMADGILQMGLYTEPRADTPATLELVVDWAELYRRGFPTPERWNDLLLPAMADLRRLLGESAMRRIDLSIRARLSAGLALGYAFQRATCPERCWGKARECNADTICQYRWVFETPHPPGVTTLHDLQDVPRPFVLRLPEDQRTTYRAGAALEFELTIIGRGADYLPYFLFGFVRLGEMGLGAGRSQARLERAEALEGWGPVGPVVYQDGRVVAPKVLPRLDGAAILARAQALSPDLRLTLETPLRVKAGGRYIEQFDSSKHCHLRADNESGL